VIAYRANIGSKLEDEVVSAWLCSTLQLHMELLIKCKKFTILLKIPLRNYGK
jgi:hypothetical protein